MSSAGHTLARCAVGARSCCCSVRCRRTGRSSRLASVADCRLALALGRARRTGASWPPRAAQQRLLASPNGKAATEPPLQSFAYQCHGIALCGGSTHLFESHRQAIAYQCHGIALCGGPTHLFQSRRQAIAYQCHNVCCVFICIFAGAPRICSSRAVKPAVT